MHMHGALHGAHVILLAEATPHRLDGGEGAQVGGHAVAAARHDAHVGARRLRVEAVDEAAHPRHLSVDVDVIGARREACRDERRAAECVGPRGRKDHAGACRQRGERGVVVRLGYQHVGLPACPCRLGSHRLQLLPATAGEPDPPSATTRCQVVRHQPPCEPTGAVEDDGQVARVACPHLVAPSWHKQVAMFGHDVIAQGSCLSRHNKPRYPVYQPRLQANLRGAMEGRLAREEASKPHLSGLGKCALLTSFFFAVAIWWVVAESNTTAMEYRTPPIKPEATTYAQAVAAAARTHTGGDRLRGTSPDARRSVRSRNGTRQQLGGAGRRETAERQRELELKTKEIQEAQKDPNSMFDMSNP